MIKTDPAAPCNSQVDTTIGPTTGRSTHISTYIFNGSVDKQLDLP